MERTLIKDLDKNFSKESLIKGSVDSFRDHGKILFIRLRDYTGLVQCVISSKNNNFIQLQKVSDEFVLELKGFSKERPDKNKTDELNGGIEFEITGFTLLAKASELPFPVDSDLNLDTKLDYRPLTLRNKKDVALFKFQAKITNLTRSFFNKNDFVEFQAPKIVGRDAEGGAGVFSLDYFDSKANLATSPQLYKQILVGSFERVFSIGNVFRAEKHSTSRHLNEYTSIDAEFGFIDDHRCVIKLLEQLMNHLVSNLKDAKELTLFKVAPILIPKEFPIFKLNQIQETIKDIYGVDEVGEPDLSPEGERLASKYAVEKFNSDFIFITHYPHSKRPFYTMQEGDSTKSFDLIFKGTEIATGGQRIHDYESLLKVMRDRNLDPESFSFYLQAFKYGISPHGGFGMGLERLTGKFLEINNVKEAAIFPRDRNRIDTKLSQ